MLHGLELQSSNPRPELGNTFWVATKGWLQRGGYKLSERFCELATKELALKPHIRGSVRFHDSIDLGRNQEDRGELVLSGL